MDMDMYLNQYSKNKKYATPNKDYQFKNNTNEKTKIKYIH